MRRLSYEEFLAERQAFDEAVQGTADISPICSSLAWQDAAFQSLQPAGREGDAFVVEDGGNWLAFMRRDPSGLYFPFEASWMFGSPLIGEAEACFDLLEAASQEWLQGRVGFFLGGMRKGGAFHQVFEKRSPHWQHVEIFAGMPSMEIDLSDGVDAWQERRSKKFRKSMRQISLPEAITTEEIEITSSDALIDRIVALQQQTYKWREGTDIFQSEGYEAFYRRLSADLHAQGQLRVRFAQCDGEDVAYILGAVSGPAYRGFQMSYVESVKGWGIGNQLQIENLQDRAEEGVVTYDLGMYAEYKERWADEKVDYLGAVAVL